MRVHIHVRTNSIEASVAFYTALLGPPSVEKSDYAKWEPSNICMTLAVSQGDAGIDHIGFKGKPEEVGPMVERLAAAGFPGTEQKGAECCYSVADKTWVLDPSQVPLEIYSGAGTIERFGDDHRPDLTSSSAACCAPGADCCTPETALQAERETLPLPPEVAALGA